jgi:hypothetical protein
MEREQAVEHRRPTQQAGELIGVDAEVDRQADPGRPAVVRRSCRETVQGRALSVSSPAATSSLVTVAMPDKSSRLTGLLIMASKRH